MKTSSAHTLILFTFLLTILVGGLTAPLLAQSTTPSTSTTTPDGNKTVTPPTNPDTKTKESDSTGLTALFALLATLSVATQKLVDIVKAWLPLMDLTPPATPPANDAAKKAEIRRQGIVQFVAGLCGVATAWLAEPAILALPICAPYKTASTTEQWLLIVVVGLLASGGSGPWNDLTTWLKTIKEKSLIEKSNLVDKSKV
jgi:hypothetical protein